jgi:hypothetical protein
LRQRLMGEPGAAQNGAECRYGHVGDGKKSSKRLVHALMRLISMVASGDPAMRA